MRSVKYLEEVRQKFDLKTNAALAKKIGVGESAMSHYMKGHRVMDEETCLAVALALEIDPTKVLMAAGIDRAEKTGQKSLWEVFSMRTSIAASVLTLVGVNLFLTPDTAEAAPLHEQPVRGLYIMSNWVRGLVRKVLAFFSPAPATATR